MSGGLQVAMLCPAHIERRERFDTVLHVMYTHPSEVLHTAPKKQGIDMFLLVGLYYAYV